MSFITGFFLALLAAFAFGSFWFWVALVIALIVVTAFVENNKGVSAFFTLLFGFLLLGPVKTAFHFIVAKPGHTALFVLGYFLFGTVWGVIKWFFYVNRELEKYNETKTAMMRSAGVTELTPQVALRLKEKYDYYGPIPQARNHKEDIMLWMTYWPFSALWTLINDPVRKIFRSIYTWLSTSLQAMSDRMFKSAQGDLAMAEAHEAALEAERKEKAEQQERERKERRGY